MRSDFATALRNLEQAQSCLNGDDELTQKMLAALGLLIDAALTAEHMRWKAGVVVPFAPVGAGLRRPPKKPFGHRRKGQPA